jgi:hypothetical protein
MKKILSISLVIFICQFAFTQNQDPQTEELVRKGHAIEGSLGFDFPLGKEGINPLTKVSIGPTIAYTYQFNNLLSLGLWIGMIPENQNISSPIFGGKLILGNKVDFLAFSLALGSYPRIGAYYKNFFFHTSYLYNSFYFELGYSAFFGEMK